MNRQYKTYHLPFAEKQQILERALAQCSSWHVDILDCTKSWARQLIDMPLPEILTKFTPDCFFSVIWRDRPDQYLEVAFSTSGSPSYFLWVFLPNELTDEFTAGMEIQ